MPGPSALDAQRNKPGDMRWDMPLRAHVHQTIPDHGAVRNERPIAIMKLEPYGGLRFARLTFGPGMR